ncbi:MAG: hypothetical protein PHP45_07630 [Elusimicrobiales bacterium]|nr:hypothetical protein [Elusimicrobiales bacterium]
MRNSLKPNQLLLGQIKLARMMTMSESEFAVAQAELENSRLFSLLKTAGIIRLSEFPHARFAAKQFAGYGLKTSVSGIGGLIDGNGELIQIIQRIGQKKFEAWFLKSESSEVEVAKDCDLTLDEIHKLRDFVDKVYIQSEFEQTGSEPSTPSEQVLSAVAGISIENGKPVLSFFHREIWKGQYAVNQQKLAEYLHMVSSHEADKAERMIGKLEFMKRRKTTLYRLLEILLKEQEAYLVSGEPSKRKPLTQRELSRDICVDASVLNRLVSNKSVQLPWGLEAPLSALIPSAKQINRELLYHIIEANPDYTDEQLRHEIEFRHGVKLSRRSIAQYRKELCSAKCHKF